MVKLILSDVDGTLLARGEGTFDDSVFEVIDFMSVEYILPRPAGEDTAIFTGSLHL